jgi:hypothetical protein
MKIATCIKLYYILKPLLPRRLQLLLHRAAVIGKLKRCSPIWPIDPKSYAKPDWFTGWPEGKQFALVLTHDVEQAGGVAHISKLQEIDRRFNIRSSFGLVPERYRIESSMVGMIREQGNEPYVHDLNHDGRLFSSYQIFKHRLPRINHYLRAWNCSGFRAGAMHRNFDWIGELDIEYDMSTFDTDPFEPMPDGAGTIFPFLVTSSITNRTYVEIPYTLPQDLLLLILHPARSIDIWIEKLSWIVSHQGMVSVNVHPDYIAFNGTPSNSDRYPVSLYEKFLTHINEQFRSIMWNPTPMEMCRFIRGATGVR